LATLKIGLPGTERPLTLISRHLCLNGSMRGRRTTASAILPMT
jgi:hypothetical protein